MFLNTFQGSYEKMRRVDIDSDEPTIADFRPSAIEDNNKDVSESWYPLQRESNGAEIIFYQEDATADVNSTVQLWGSALHNGPAELIAEISGTVGTAGILNDTTALAWDTMNIVFDGLPVNIVASDASGSNRPSRITFDTMGLKYLKPIWTDISSVGNNALIRVY
jgi:hypothetical protein